MGMPATAETSRAPERAAVVAAGDQPVSVVMWEPRTGKE